MGTEAVKWLLYAQTPEQMLGLGEFEGDAGVALDEAWRRLSKLSYPKAESIAVGIRRPGDDKEFIASRKLKIENDVAWTRTAKPKTPKTVTFKEEEHGYSEDA